MLDDEGNSSGSMRGRSCPGPRHYTALTFQKAFDIAQGIEAAVQGAQELANVQPTQPAVQQAVQKIHPHVPKQSASKTECYRCGGNHASTSCRYRQSDCHLCGKRGHISRVCKSKAKQIQCLMTLLPPWSKGTAFSH